MTDRTKPPEGDDCIHAVPEGSECEVCAQVVHVHKYEDWPDEMGVGVKYVIHGPVRLPPWMTRAIEDGADG